MRFGPVPVAEALGAILAHGTRLAGGTLKKGRVLERADLERLAEAGIAEVVVARLEADDVPEDEAAERLAHVVSGEGVEAGASFTGRVNLFAARPGLLEIASPDLDAVNAVDEALTVATLPDGALVEERQMVATVKVIPFAAPRAALERLESIAAAGSVRVRALMAMRVALVQTRLPGTRESVLDKTRGVLEARLIALGSTLVAERRCAHAEAEVCAALAELIDDADLVLVAGASAIVDRRDVVPAAVVAAGGAVRHFGMPVDPGNLLLLAEVGATPIIGLPGCARSPKFNGFDQVLRRIAAGLEAGPPEIVAMGVGGLLKEIPDRPAPRATRGGEARAPARLARVAALVLAAGQSRRMGATNKMLAEIGGEPMVRVVARAVGAARVAPVVVVTGHEHRRVEAALAAEPVRLVHNPDYAEGISTSLRRGLAALDEGVEAVVVCLADMPEVSARHVERLVAAFDPVEGREICVPVHRGKRGNPVLFGRRFFDAMAQVRGDVGARHLIGEFSDWVCEVPMGDSAVLVDLDTQDALQAWTAGREAGP